MRVLYENLRFMKFKRIESILFEKVLEKLSFWGKGKGEL